MTKFKAQFPELETIKNVIGPKKSKDLNCILGISIGQSYHEGEKLDAIIEGINENFSKCYVEIGDSLQRYNKLMLGLSEEEARKEAILMGETWGKANLKIIKKLTIPYEIHYWDERISLDEHKKALKTVIDLYNTNPKYKDALDFAISQIFVIKKNNVECKVTKEAAEELIKQYLEEELAVVLLWEEKIGLSVFVYPNSAGKAPQSACECYKKLIDSVSQEFKLYIGNIEFSTINKQPEKKTRKEKKEFPSADKQIDNSSNKAPMVNYTFNFFPLSSSSTTSATTHPMTETNLVSPREIALISTIFQKSATTLLKINTDSEKEKLESFTANVMYKVSNLFNNTTSKNISNNEFKRFSI